MFRKNSFLVREPEFLGNAKSDYTWKVTYRKTEYDIEDPEKMMNT